MPNVAHNRRVYEILALSLAVFLCFSSVISLTDLSVKSPNDSDGRETFTHIANAQPLFHGNTPSLSAEHAALITANGTLLCGKAYDEQAGMASTTKIMTGLLAAEYIEAQGKDAVTTVSRSASGIEGSSVYLEVGETVRLIDLLYATLLASANDAATALAEAVSGSEAAFVAAMNDRAKAMGLVFTHFENPHGLSSDSHRTTAYELALLAANAMENRLFATVVATKQYRFESDTAARSFANHNRLLTSYEGAIGIKTGFTKATGRCLVSAAERNGTKLIAVTLNAPDDWNDHRALMDFGFSHTETVTLAQTGEFSYSLSLIGGGSIAVSNPDSLSVTLPIPHGEISCLVELPPFAFRDSQSSCVGKVIFYENGKKLGEVFLEKVTE